MPQKTFIPIAKYRYDEKRPHASEALRLLKLLALLVYPIMKQRNLKVGTLAELYRTESPGLMGLNTNRGSKIQICLRKIPDQNSFVPVECLLDTLLHELCHNIHDSHGDSFHLLWRELHKDYAEVVRKAGPGANFPVTEKNVGARWLGAQWSIEKHGRWDLERTCGTGRAEAEPRGAASGERIVEAPVRPRDDVDWNEFVKSFEDTVHKGEILAKRAGLPAGPRPDRLTEMPSPRHQSSGSKGSYETDYEGSSNRCSCGQCHESDYPSSRTSGRLHEEDYPRPTPRHSSSSSSSSRASTSRSSSSTKKPVLVRDKSGNIGLVRRATTNAAAAGGYRDPAGSSRHGSPQKARQEPSSGRKLSAWSLLGKLIIDDRRGS